MIIEQVIEEMGTFFLARKGTKWGDWHYPLVYLFLAILLDIIWYTWTKLYAKYMNMYGLFDHTVY